MILLDRKKHENNLPNESKYYVLGFKHFILHAEKWTTFQKSCGVKTARF